MSDIDLMSHESELKRIDHTATIWFAAALVAVAVTVLGLTIVEWRPSDLAPTAEAAWWIATTVAGIGLAAIGYAGCPIYWGNPRVAHLQKSIAIRGGLVCFLIGSWVAIIAMFAF